VELLQNRIFSLVQVRNDVVVNDRQILVPVEVVNAWLSDEVNAATFIKGFQAKIILFVNRSFLHGHHSQIRVKISKLAENN
jgi:hypothetical protein